ncbi:bidirectional sugar transporter SWEET1-like isoform X1 [Papaver somniferum]|uniref:bidirectional sugar transporter SWEET1-like isoform X1 n=1 Tax=Papaver somniferum TaxID=3469 RepID=UPI000E6F4A65|nr:bidirectional sugar transporter SWEET1-like isoform X1 [Papaver somniferum]
MNIIRFCFGICGNVTALFLFLSPLMTFRRIIKSKSTQQFSGVPYIMTLLNCLLSGWYGLPFVSPHNILVATINGIGAVIEGIYVVIFMIYAPKKDKLKLMVLLALALITFASVSMVSLLVIHEHETRLFFCGLAATIFSINMYASPLSVMVTNPHKPFRFIFVDTQIMFINFMLSIIQLQKLVIRTKSVEYMPFLLSLFVFLCGTFWFVYGLLGGDPFITVPNGFGCVLGALQLILYAVYRNPKGKAVVADDGASVMPPPPTTTTTTACSSPEEDDDFIELGFEKPLQKTAATCVDDTRIDVL